MQRFTEVVGRPVLLADRTRLGTLVDLTVHLPSAPTVGDPTAPSGLPIERLAVGHRQAIAHLVPWTAVDRIDDGSIILGDRYEATSGVPGHRAGVDDALADDELLLGRDVLDTQVVDLEGRRLARVADVALGTRSDGRLEALAVDVGFGAVCRRLGLRRLADRLGDAVVAWPDLHLTSARAHRVQLAGPRGAIHRLSSAELSEIVGRLTVEHGAAVLAAVPADRAAEALVATRHDTRHRLLHALPPEHADDVVAHLDATDAEHAHRFRQVLAGDRPLPRRLGRHAGWRRNGPKSTAP